jgi:hypothetical protein
LIDSGKKELFEGVRGRAGYPQCPPNHVRDYACINLTALLFRANARTNRCGGRARFNTQLAKDMLKVFIDGARAHAKYLSDVAVGFSFCKPR